MQAPWEFEDPSCKGIDTELFFPPESPLGNFYSRKQEDTEMFSMIKSMCSMCVERKACLEWALHHEKEGVWAGTTALDRSRMRRKLNIRLGAFDA